MQTKNSTLAKCFIMINTLALLLAPATMQADDALWSGSASDLWSLPGNWVGSPPVPGTGNTATFNSAGGSTTVNLESGVTISNIVFDTAGAAAYTIGSGVRDAQTLTLNAGGAITMSAGVSSNQYFNSLITLNTTTNGTESFSIINSSTEATLNLTGTIQPSSLAVGAVRTLNMGGSGDINANIVRKVGSGTFTVVKSGTGTLMMGDPIPYVAENTDNNALAMIVNEGTVIMAKTNASRRAVGAILEAHNDALIRIAGSNGDQIYDGVDLTFSGNAAIDLNGRNETVDAFNGSSGTKVYNTANGSTSTLIVGGGNAGSTFNGTMSNNAGGGQSGILAFGKTGTGTHTLTGTNSYTGGTTIYGGVLAAGLISENGACNIGSGKIVLQGGTLRYTGTNDVNLTREIRANADGGIDIADKDTTFTVNSGFYTAGRVVSKRGAGTLVLTGTADNNGFVLSAEGGLTRLDKNADNTVRAVAGIKNIAAGATVQLTGTGVDQIYGDNIGGSYGHVTMSGGTFDMNAKSETIGILEGTGVVINNGAESTTSILTVGQVNGGGEFSGAIRDGINGGAVELRKIGTGVMTFKASSGLTNSYSGATMISGGTLRLDQPPQTPFAGSSLWLDAADTNTVTLAAGKVAAWADKSGNNRNATQGTAANQPGYITNSKVGALNVLDLDGVNDLLNVDLTFMANTDFTIFAVEGRQENTQGYLLGTTSASLTRNRLHYGYRDDNSFTLALYSHDFDYNSSLLPYDGNQVFRLWTSRLKQADPARGMAHYLNGSLVAGPQADRNLPLLSADGGRIGTGFGTGDQYFNGDIGELLIYTNVLSDVDRAVVEKYLVAKWITPIPATGVLPGDTALNITASGAAFDLNGVNQQIGSLTGVAGSSVTLGSGTLTVAGTNDTVFAGTVSGSGTLAIAGSGTLTLTAPNALPSAGTLSMAGGTVDLSAVTSSAASLKVTAPSTLVIGSGELSFETQTPDAWTGTLTISGELGATALRFQPSLTVGQLAAISFTERPGAKAYCTAEGYLAIIAQGTIILLQ